MRCSIKRCSEGISLRALAAVGAQQPAGEAVEPSEIGISPVAPQRSQHCTGSQQGLLHRLRVCLHAGNARAAGTRVLYLCVLYTDIVSVFAAAKDLKLSL